MDHPLHVEQLRAAGARGDAVDELLRYNGSSFGASGARGAPAVPLADEPFVGCWATWCAAARERGAFTVLAEALPQLAFPIREGVSATADYRAATLKGTAVEGLAEATGLGLERPEALGIDLHTSFAGRIPVLTIRHRPDFVTLLRALARRNEPVPVSDAQGAIMIAGYNNWQRIHELRRHWEALPAQERSTATWADEFKRIRADKELYQDRFILLSDGPYSAVPAADLGLGEEDWREISLTIRREHECTHYFTRRYFGSMRNHLFDELMADYVGIVAARGRYTADWFLHFVGLEAHPRYRPGARLDLYRGDPPLSDAAFRVLHTLVVAAARNIERFDRAKWPERPRSHDELASAVCALSSSSLLELAEPGGSPSLVNPGD